MGARPELTLVFETAAQPTSLAEVRRLFEEYQASVGVDLCFQGFAEELETLAESYAGGGRLFLATVNGESAGCVGLRRWSGDICEMKRLYVRPAYRSAGLGRRLVELVIEAAKEIGYDRMRLDTLPSMGRAQALYREFGFRPIAPYRENPVPGALYFELALRRGDQADAK